MIRGKGGRACPFVANSLARPIDLSRWSGAATGGPWTGAETSLGQGVVLVSTAAPLLSRDPVKGNEGQTHGHEDETHSSETGRLGGESGDNVERTLV